MAGTIVGHRSGTRTVAGAEIGTETRTEAKTETDSGFDFILDLVKVSVRNLSLYRNSSSGLLIGMDTGLHIDINSKLFMDSYIHPSIDILLLFHGLWL